jgi:hypothetical protein
MDELAAVLDAAAEQDLELPPGGPTDVGHTAAMVRRLVSKGLRPSQIASELAITKSTVTHHLRRLGAEVGPGYVGRRVVCEILGRSGVRASELCDLKIGQVRLHDPAGARFHIPDAKTDTGIREVQMSPDLAEAVVTHLDRLRRIGAPSGPDDYLVPNLRGGRMTRQRVWKIVGEAARLATQRLMAKGLPPLPNTTPHTLRRTYISIALLRQQLRCQVGDGPGGSCGLEDEARRLRPARAACRSATRNQLRSIDPSRPRGTYRAASADRGRLIRWRCRADWDTFGTRAPQALRPPPGVGTPGAARKRITKPIPKWRGPESNWRHHDFQSCALPTELPRRGAQRLAAEVPAAVPAQLPPRGAAN